MTKYNKTTKILVKDLVKNFNFYVNFFYLIYCIIHIDDIINE